MINNAFDRIWILGSADTEMEATEKLLLACGERVEYAMVADGSRRVSAGEAYRAASPRDALVWANGTGTIYAVECDWQHLDGETGDVQHLDHHRPGDRGFGVSPEEFMCASSIGQVVAELARLGLILSGCKGWDGWNTRNGHPPGDVWLHTFGDGHLERKDP